MKRIISIFGLNALLYLALQATSVTLPEKVSVSSPSGIYSATITPAAMPDMRAYSNLQEEYYSILFKGENHPPRESLICWMALHSKRANDEGNGLLLWERPIEKLVAPLSVYVTDEGYVLALGSWPGTLKSDEVALSLYDFSGKLTHRYALEDIFTNKQMAQLRDSSGLGGRWWGHISVGKNTASEESFLGSRMEAKLLIIEVLREPGDDALPRTIALRTSGDGAGDLFREWKGAELSKRGRTKKREK